MSGGRVVTLMLALAGTVLIGAGLRYAHRGTSYSAEGASSVDSPVRATVRLYKDPSPVAPFAAADLDGHMVSSASFKGKVVIVNFWATWCPPCRAEIPDLIALQDKYRDRLQIIGVSEDDVPPAEVKQFVVEHHFNYPVVMSTPDIQKRFPGVPALPTSFFLDPEGRLVQKHTGMLRPQLTELETRALAGLPVDATIERVDRAEGLKLEAGAQLLEIPGIELASLSKTQRVDALQKLNATPCTCGCDLTVAKCRVDDPSCGVSLPLAREIVARIADAR